MHAVAKYKERGHLPPFLWVWLAAYAVYLPTEVTSARNRLYALFGGGSFGPNDVFLTGVFQLPLILLSLTFLAGILTVLLPWMRLVYLKKRYSVSGLTSQSPAVRQIENFVHKHAPEIKVEGNLLRTDQLAFVFPLGYRTTAIAVFGGLVKLWRSDREAAEAVILHEVAHHRNGDTLIVGAGSVFTTLIRYNPLIAFLALLLAVPAQSLSHGFSPGNIPSTMLRLTPIALANSMLIMIIALLVPVVAIWCTEFNADRYAADAQGSPGALMRVLAKHSGRTSPWRWLVFRFTHPPRKLRRWMARETAGTMRPILLLLLFPLAAVVQPVLDEALEIAPEIFLHTFYPHHKLWDVYVAGLATNPNTKAWYLLAIVGVVALWPVVAKYWEGIFSGKLRRTNGWSGRKEHLFTAAI